MVGRYKYHNNGAAGDLLACIVPRGTVRLRTELLPRGIVMVSIRSLGVLGVFHRFVGVVPGAPSLWSWTGARVVCHFETICSGRIMSTGGAGTNGHGRDGKLPSNYRPPGGVDTNLYASASPEGTPPTPPASADQAVFQQFQVADNLKEAIEALQRRLTVQELT